MKYKMDQDILHPAVKDLTTELLRSREVELNIANSLWVQEGLNILNKFMYVINRSYSDSYFEVNFKRLSEACAKINYWVSERTNKKITEIVNDKSISAETKLILVNAIYFKGIWMSTLKESETKNDEFTLNSGERVSVPMMYQKSSFGYFEENDFQAINMRYLGHNLSMVLFLPKKIDGMMEFEKKLNYLNLEEYLTRFNDEKVELYLPKFIIEEEYSLKKHLISLGMSNAFSDDADFSGITDPKELKISEVIHKTFLEVNEKGTEAAAVTALGMTVLGFSPKVKPPIIFRVDHPFLFLIYDSRSKTILFVGRIMNPLEKSSDPM